ncbi:MAG: penicillin-binding protein 2 [Clostridia bacterium]|nr:penicillin-binding protein 2 [Clostridia bacterium]
MEKLFWRIFAKRSLISFFILIFLLFTCILRVAEICSKNYSEVQANLSSIKIEITNQRGTIFDCNGYPLTNNKKKIIACVSPTPRAITAISTVLKGDELESVLETLKNGKPAICEVERKIECDGILCTEIYATDNYIPAIHSIGYCDGDNNGVCGLEKSYNSYLQSEYPLTVRYACDGKGRILQGVAPTIENKISPLSYGVVSTIDINIQNIVESAAENLTKGAIVVADVKTAKIRGIVSVPTFTTDSIENLLNHPLTPLYNRTLGAYNVGSVFKLCVAASAIENGYQDFKYTCKGSCKIIDRTFKCHNLNGHGMNDLNSAISQSCNTYFYNLGIKSGANNLITMASNLNFGKTIRLSNNISTAKGTLPTLEKLQNIAHLANFSIGQGDFTAAPISLLPLYCAIATDGKYYMPSIVEGTTKNAKITKYNYGSPTRAFSKSTANKLKKALSLVVTEGTGVLGNPRTVTAAGKTATAQTGKFLSGKEIESSWFCGFFPLESPKYVVVLFAENKALATKPCAQIFAEIADKIVTQQ